MQKYLRKHYFTLFKMITFSCTVRPNFNLVPIICVYFNIRSKSFEKLSWYTHIIVFEQLC